MHHGIVVVLPLSCNSGGLLPWRELGSEQKLSLRVELPLVVLIWVPPFLWLALQVLLEDLLVPSLVVAVALLARDHIDNVWQ